MNRKNIKTLGVMQVGLNKNNLTVPSISFINPNVNSYFILLHENSSHTSLTCSVNF